MSSVPIPWQGVRSAETSANSPRSRRFAAVRTARQPTILAAIHASVPSAVAGGTEWSPHKTLKINLNFSSALSQGTYLDKVVVPIGVSDEHFFGM